MQEDGFDSSVDLALAHPRASPATQDMHGPIPFFPRVNADAVTHFCIHQCIHFHFASCAFFRSFRFVSDDSSELILICTQFTH